MVARALACLATVSAAGAVPATAAALPPDDGPRRCTRDGVAVHVVVVGDTWFEIAQEAGVGLRTILLVNDAGETDLIRPGDEVCVPDDDEAADTPPATTTTTEPPAPTTSSRLP